MSFHLTSFITSGCEAKNPMERRQRKEASDVGGKPQRVHSIRTMYNQVEPNLLIL